MKQEPQPVRRVPKYRRQKRKRCADQAFVELNGHRHYLGLWASPESEEKYRRLVSEWLAGGGELPVAKHHITVSELIWRYFLRQSRSWMRPTSRNDPFA